MRDLASEQEAKDMLAELKAKQQQPPPPAPPPPPPPPVSPPIVVVDPDPSKPTPIAPVLEAYAEAWWLRANKDTSPERGADALPWQKDDNWIEDVGKKGWPNPTAKCPNGTVVANGGGMFDWPLKPEHVAGIQAFRTKAGVMPDNVKLTTGFADSEHSPIGDNRKKYQLHTDAKALFETLAATQKKIDDKAAAIDKETAGKANPIKLKQLNADLVALASKKTDLGNKVKANESALDSAGKADPIRDIDEKMKATDEELKQMQKDGLVDCWVYGGKGATQAELDSLSSTDEFVKRAILTFKHFQKREAGLNGLMTYDGTFSYGPGNNLSTGLDFIMKYMLHPPTAPLLTPELEQARLEAAAFFKKAGIWFGSCSGGIGPLVAHIDSSGAKPRGWVVQGITSGDVSVKYGDHEPHDFAFEYIRHTKDVLNLWTQVGLNDSLPGGTSTSVRLLFVRLAFQTYLDMWRPSFRLHKLLATQAGFTLLAHLQGWGMAYAPDMFIGWAFAREKVATTVTHADGAVTRLPISIRVGNTDADEDTIVNKEDTGPAKKGQTKTKEVVEPGIKLTPHTPSAQTDIQVAQAAVAFLCLRFPTYPNRAYNWGPLYSFWLQFCGDIKKADEGGYTGEIPPLFEKYEDVLNAEIVARTKDGVVPPKADVDKELRGKYTLVQKVHAHPNDMPPGVYIIGSKSDAAEVRAFYGEPAHQALLVTLLTPGPVAP